MKVRMKTSAASPTWTANEGDIVNRPDEEARQLLEGGYAEKIEEPDATPSEAAVVAAIEWTRQKLDVLTIKT